MVEKEFGQETKVAAPPPLTTAVDFEKGEMVVAVDFVTGRVEESTLMTVTFKG